MSSIGYCTESENMGVWMQDAWKHTGYVHPGTAAWQPRPRAPQQHERNHNAIARLGTYPNPAQSTVSTEKVQFLLYSFYFCTTIKSKNEGS